MTASESVLLGHGVVKLCVKWEYVAVSPKNHKNWCNRMILLRIISLKAGCVADKIKKIVKSWWGFPIRGYSEGGNMRTVRMLTMLIWAINFCSPNLLACEKDKCVERQDNYSVANKKRKKVKRAFKKLKKKLNESQDDSRRMVKIMYALTTIQAELELQRRKCKRLKTEISTLCLKCSS